MSADSGSDFPASSPRELELAPGEFRRLVELALGHIERYVSSLPDQAAHDVEGSLELARSLIRDLPETGEDAAAVLEELFERAVRKGFNTASPGYFAYIPGGGILHAALADLIAGAVNRYVTVWQASPGLAQIETTVIRWFCDMVGLPRGSGGFLSTGGSMANLSALVTARSCRLGERFEDGVLYASTEAHHSIRKAALIAGFPGSALRLVPVDERFRIRVDELDRAVEDDRACGRRPFLVVANAGSTNTGAVDDLEALSTFARRENLWMHVDAAYGGFFLLTDRGRRAMKGIEGADTVTLDPHKGMFLPYGTGCLLARDRSHLQKAHSVPADYMPVLQTGDELVDFCEISPELSRGTRGLRIWLPVRLHGIGAFRRSLDEKLDLAHLATERLRTIPGLEIVAEPQLSLVAFRLTRAGLTDEKTDRLNQELLDRILGDPRIFLTATRAGGRFVLRICVLSFRSHLDRLEECLATIEKAVEAMRSG